MENFANGKFRTEGLPLIVLTPEKLSTIQGDANFCVYVIKCKRRNHYYVGYTAKLRKRIIKHKKGPGSRFTNYYGSDRLIHVEHFETIKEAKKRESELTRELRSIYGNKNIGGPGYYKLK